MEKNSEIVKNLKLGIRARDFLTAIEYSSTSSRMEK